MCQTLQAENIKYIFYDINTKNYYDNNKNEKINIKDNMNKVSNNYYNNNNDKIKTGIYNLNNDQKKEIIKILEGVYESTDISFQLFNTGSLCVDHLKKCNLFCITQIMSYIPYETIETYMFYIDNNEYKSVLLKEYGGSSKLDTYLPVLAFFKQTFDYYKIILE